MPYEYPEPIPNRKPEDSHPSVFDLGDVLPVPDETLRRLDGDIDAAGGLVPPDPALEGAIGFTMFDSRGSEDNSLTVLLSSERIADAPSQSLVRIRSLKDHRDYLGTVVAGPFAEPDGLRADSNVLVTVVTRGGIFRAPYHGRVQVEILGEQRDGALVPPRYRPLPNSPVFVLDDRETAEVLRADGDIQIGQVVGHEAVTVAIPSTRKDVLPRHTAILGTTGGGKSTTVARLVQQAQSAGCAVILLDVEGEYTFLHEPTTDPTMLAALDRRGLAPAGLTKMWLCHLVGRETANPDHPRRAEFCLRFERPSPYTVMELLDLTDAQRVRFLRAYDTAKALLRELGIFPERGRPDQENDALDVDEFDRGHPKLELAFLMDVVSAFGLIADKGDAATFRPRHPAIRTDPDRLFKRVRAAKPDHPESWRALLGKLGSLNRLRVFDRSQNDQGRPVLPLNYPKLLQPGAATVVDLSDTGSPVVNNLVIADLLRGVQEAQDTAYAAFEAARRRGEDVEPPTRVLIVIEEAHEFLSAERPEPAAPHRSALGILKVGTAGGGASRGSWAKRLGAGLSRPAWFVRFHRAGTASRMASTKLNRGVGTSGATATSYPLRDTERLSPADEAPVLVELLSTLHGCDQRPAPWFVDPPALALPAPVRVVAPPVGAVPVVFPAVERGRGALPPGGTASVLAPVAVVVRVVFPPVLPAPVVLPLPVPARAVPRPFVPVPVAFAPAVRVRVTVPGLVPLSVRLPLALVRGAFPPAAPAPDAFLDGVLLAPALVRVVP